MQPLPRASSPASPLAVCGLLLACQPSGTPPAVAPRGAEACQGEQADLLRLLETLPPRGLAVRGRSDLPVASLGGVIGSGKVIDISDQVWRLDGEPLDGATETERLTQLRAALESAVEAAGDGRRQLAYLAVPASTDIGTIRRYLTAVPDGYDVHLVFQAPPSREPGTTPGPSGRSAAERLLSESDPNARRDLAEAAYRQFATCEPVLDAVARVGAGDPAERWPALRRALLAAVPACRCDDLDAPNLREVLLAEQRAGAAAVGSVPFDFVRDERCGASLGLAPVQKVVEDIEAFDAEFAGKYGQEAVEFAQVLTNDRLLTYLCPALPGETLAAMQRRRHTFFWKVSGTGPCQAWQFEPLQPGSPMGTWRRVGAANEPPLSVHYWQGAEEIRLYGPVSNDSKPTDDREWACNQDFRMRAIDAESIALDAGRWFFTESACQEADEAEAVFPGCVAALARGAPLEALGQPAVFPAHGDGEP